VKTIDVKLFTLETCFLGKKLNNLL
jgi:hypothetical protein